MRSRGAIPPRVRKPKKANKAARPPLAATTRHQARQAEEPESTQDSSEAVEEFQSSTPLFSRSPTAGPSRVPRPPTPPTLASHSPTPGPSLVPRTPTPPLRRPSLLRPRPVLSPCSPLRKSSFVCSLLTDLTHYRSIWTTEVSKCLAFELELPGIEHPHDVELVIQGQLLAVYARSDTVAYKWSTNVGGPVKVSISVRQRSPVADSTRLITSIADSKTRSYASASRSCAWRTSPTNAKSSASTVSEFSPHHRTPTYALRARYASLVDVARFPWTDPPIPTSHHSQYPRYHVPYNAPPLLDSHLPSLAISSPSCTPRHHVLYNGPPCLIPTSRHSQYPRYRVQFHSPSCTTYLHTLLDFAHLVSTLPACIPTTVVLIMYIYLPRNICLMKSERVG